ncbi:hypothetical protein H8E88_04355 [candidate division KSB1 bacterium]|nr:hypothetical protein [candidate division KSB1 bacterium]MBL7095015.1 hypothetical protein [candidate division KSB1 bacterium]
MLSYKEKLVDDISLLNDEQARKFYHFFQLIKKEFLAVQNNDWKKDFKNISVWKDDNFDQIKEGFKNWKIEEF